MFRTPLRIMVGDMGCDHEKAALGRICEYVRDGLTAGGIDSMILVYRQYHASVVERRAPLDCPPQRFRNRVSTFHRGASVVQRGHASEDLVEAASGFTVAAPRSAWGSVCSLSPVSSPTTSLSEL